MKSTKRSMLVSGLCLLLTAVMLMGSTFAWFTDSVTNQGNKIQAGTLDVQLLENGLDISDSKTPIFDDALWEPGYATGTTLAVKNNGSLALKYQLVFSNLVVTQDLDKVLDVYVLDTYRAPTAADVPVGTLADFANGQAIDSGVLAAGTTSADICIVIKMQEQAGNTYQGAAATFDIALRAVQAPVEEDGFGSSDYDASADGNPDNPAWGEITTGQVTVPVNPEGDTVVKGTDGMTTFTVPQAAVDPDAQVLVLNITRDQLDQSVPVAANQEAATYAVTLEGLAADNTTPVEVSLYVGKDLSGVALYRGAAQIADAQYDPQTGMVTFRTTEFGLLTLVYDRVWTGGVDEAGLAANTDDSAKTVTIESPGQLAAFAQKVNSGTTYAGYTVTLTGNMDLGGANWTPIGSNGKMFRGTFDGGDHVISGLTAVNNLAYGNGFFGNLAGATVRNITFDGAYVSRYPSTSSSISGNVYGIVSGYAYGNVTFSNVHVTNSAVRGYGKVGGILGMAAEPGTSVTKLENCTVENTVITAAYNAGGLIGLAQNVVDMTGSETQNVTPKLADKASAYVDLDTVAEEYAYGASTGKQMRVTGKYWVYEYQGTTFYYAAWGDYYTDYYYEADDDSAWLLAEIAPENHYLADGLCHNK